MEELLWKGSAMTVAELIEELKKMPQDAEVLVCGENPPTVEVGDVQYVANFCDFNAGVSFPDQGPKVVLS